MGNSASSDNNPGASANAKSSSFSFINSLLFQPPNPASYIHPQKSFHLITAEGRRIPAFLIDRNSSITILFSHGNAEDLGSIYDYFYDFSRQLNVNVLAYDYTGYGQNASAENPPSEENCYSDIEAAYKYLVEQRRTPPEQIVLYGRSLGSGPSCYLAEKLGREGVQLGGVVLQSPLASAFRVAFNFRFTMPGDCFANIDRMINVRCYVYIIHGTRDEVVPFWHGEQLFFATPVKWRAKPFWIDGAGHNNIETLLREDNTFIERMAEFLNSYARRVGAGSSASVDAR